MTVEDDYRALRPRIAAEYPDLLAVYDERRDAVVAAMRAIFDGAALDDEETEEETPERAPAERGPMFQPGARVRLPDGETATVLDEGQYDPEAGTFYTLRFADGRDRRMLATGLALAEAAPADDVVLDVDVGDQIALNEGTVVFKIRGARRQGGGDTLYTGATTEGARGVELTVDRDGVPIKLRAQVDEEDWQGRRSRRWRNEPVIDVRVMRSGAAGPSRPKVSQRWINALRALDSTGLPSTAMLAKIGGKSLLDELRDAGLIEGAPLAPTLTAAGEAAISEHSALRVEDHAMKLGPWVYRLEAGTAALEHALAAPREGDWRARVAAGLDDVSFWLGRTVGEAIGAGPALLHDPTLPDHVRTVLARAYTATQRAQDALGHAALRAPGYASWKWTQQDWRVVVPGRRAPDVRYDEKCGGMSNRTPSGLVRLCLPLYVIERLRETSEGRSILYRQAKRKERAEPGTRVPWHPRIRELHAELEARGEEDDPRRRRG